MNKIGITFYMLFFSFYLYSQDPYIKNGTVQDGLGQYGYLEYNATTFANLDRATHADVKHLGARWWVDDGNNATNGGGFQFEYWTNPNDNNWTCSGDNDQDKYTNDFVSADFNGEWNIGASCYVSVYGENCSNTKYPNNGTGVGYNERKFQVVDVDNTPFSGITDVLYDANGDCAPHVLVGSFVIDPGSLSNLSLKRIWFENIGTSVETTDIPNDGFKVFYEEVTGSETFESDEDVFNIYGDYGGDATNNNRFGNNDLGNAIKIMSKTRFYVALCDVNYPHAHGETVRLQIINDGISISPAPDGYNKDLLRIDITDISNNAITIPISLIDFNAKFNLNNKTVDLSWTTLNEINNSHFNILRSEDAKRWTSIFEILANEKSNGKNYYSAIDKSPNSGINYYKLEQVDLDGKSIFYNPVLVKSPNNSDINVYPNPVNSNLKVITNHSNLRIKIFNTMGEMIKSERLDANHELDFSDYRPGLYLVKFSDEDNKFITVKSIIKK